MRHRTTVPVCEPCTRHVRNHNTNHRRATIAASIEVMHNPRVTRRRPDGYFRCFVCGDDAIGGQYIDFEDHG